MDILQLYSDYSVDYKTEGHKHCRDGWVNTPCPFCISEPGHEGYHLGYEIDTNYFVCWRCGFHTVSLTLSKLLNIPEGQIWKLVKQYGISVPILSKTPVVKSNKVPFTLPMCSWDILPNAVDYLIGRKFDPELIVSLWGIKSTGPFAKLSKLDYKHRIIIPFSWNNVMVSFDSRDITDKASNKYMACPLEKELISHKEILYGKDIGSNDKRDIGIIVEGPTDVWRFGVDSFATSGIKYTPAQVRVIAKIFKKVPVCFDGGEPQAIAQANKLVAELKFRGADAFRVDIEGDPGGMEQGEADYLVKQLIN